ncbi:MAG: selenocysteine-specific translation elongation factor [Brachybacterium sp.]|nr:selenocysteine-specific translation elongation factor [Brachybacterium sp.]
MRVVATAGHVDHGKSALVRALTGIEPDRWTEEKRRGLTIDLGFAWTTLPSGTDVAVVDVPGHERFLGNMLAGLGPAPVVCFVVAADEGWQAQSSDHRDAVAALGIEHGLIVLTRADLAAPERIAEVEQDVRRELSGTALADAPALAVSAKDGTGLEELRTALDTVFAAAGAPDPGAPVRLWVDRAFSIAGAGTVVTGTLAAGAIRTGDQLHLLGAAHTGTVTVRGLQTHEDTVDRLGPVSRAAVNLRGIGTDQVGRGDVLLTPDAWHLTDVIDVRRRTGSPLDEAPREPAVHVGTASIGARLRPFGPDHARLTLTRPMPLRLGDRIVLRGSGQHAVFAGVQILDVDVPALDRRGDGRRREQALAALPEEGDISSEVRRRRAAEESQLRRQGHQVPHPLPTGIERIGAHLVDTPAMGEWGRQLRAAVDRVHRHDPLAPGLPRRAAAGMLDLPDAALLDAVVERAGLATVDGCVADPEATAGLGAAEAGIATLEARLTAAPFRAPEAEDLAALDLGAKQLAAAERQGRILRLPVGVVLLPTAPALAMRELAPLTQPFTTSEARQALDTTRRVAIPLLEHLDGRGWTRRVDGTRREVVR